MAAHLRRDKTHLDVLGVLVSGRDPPDRSHKLGEAEANQPPRSWAGVLLIPGFCSGAYLLISSLLTVSAELRASLVQFRNELDNRLARPLVQECHSQWWQRQHRGFARYAYRGYNR